MNLSREDFTKIGASEILNSLADGAYITDLDRNILFWNPAAERITGWRARDVVGRSCFDNILVHVDKDGHQLCGHEHCPLHRSIVTGESSREPMLVFAQAQAGARIPVEVSVAPIRDHAGSVIGGIEIFRDLTAAMQDLARAREIQQCTLECKLPQDDRVECEIRYTPSEIVGGDFYRVERVDNDRYAILVADVMGHGVAAALYTMQLRSLWEDHREELLSAGFFLTRVNRRLTALARDAGYFATAAGACFNAATGELRYVRAGHPAPLILRRDGAIETLDRADPGLGMFEETVYSDSVTCLAAGDTMLLYTDGAVEISNPAGDELGTEGLVNLVSEMTNPPDLAELEERLLRYSNQIRLTDDLTLVRLRRLG